MLDTIGREARFCASVPRLLLDSCESNKKILIHLYQDINDGIVNSSALKYLIVCSLINIYLHHETSIAADWKISIQLKIFNSQLIIMIAIFRVCRNTNTIILIV